MPIEAHFYKNRCLFNRFDQHTDLNPYSRKPGVNYYRFNFIGALLAKFGFAKKIECRMSNKSCTIYLNKKSFQKWIRRHQEDPGLDRADLNEARVAKLWEKVIDLISKNFFKPKLPQGKQAPLSTKKVLEKAEKDFAIHPLKDEILARIKKRLLSFKYDEELASGKPITFVFNWEDTLWYPRIISGNERTVIRETTKFLSKLPGINAMALY